MTIQRRLKIDDLDLTIHDPFANDIELIHDEIFVRLVYEHPLIALPERPVVMDVGANVGLFAIWAARRYGASRILSYEASPTTYACLIDNVQRHVPAETTDVACFHLAVSDEAGRKLTLHQPPWNSGLSTLLDGDKLPWVEELRAKGELQSHAVTSTTVSHEIARLRLAKVDLLKIDVEGHYMAVLDGIAPADFAKIGHIVFEADYTDELGLTAEDLCAKLEAMGFEAVAVDVGFYTLYARRR